MGGDVLMTVVTEVEKPLTYGPSTLSTTVLRTRTTRRMLATVGIIVAATVVVAGGATVVGYFLLAREEGEFTER
jgi:hypothetical protein